MSIDLLLCYAQQYAACLKRKHVDGRLFSSLKEQRAYFRRKLSEVRAEIAKTKEESKP